MPVLTLTQKLERRRRRAIALLAAGHSQAAVARRLGVSRSSVSRWQALLHNGSHKLAATPRPGRPRRLTPSQLHTLQQLLHAGATAYSWPTDRWTATRVTTLIFRTFGVEYHPDHVRKIMKKLNF